MKRKNTLFILGGILVFVNLIFAFVFFIDIPFNITGNTILDLEDIDFEKDCVEIEEGRLRCFLGTIAVEPGDTSSQDFDVSME